MIRTVGSYKLLEVLGEGAMGTVFRALDTQLDREVALKSLRPDLASRADVVERFREEARLQGRLESPNIVRLYQFLQEGDEFFMVMEFVRGSTLSQVLSQNKRLPAGQAINIMVQALNGLGHAHSKNVIHRDVKPANIMIGEDGVAKVTDFGIARLLGSARRDRMTKAGSIVGTLEFISPEAVLGQEVTALSDIYSCGLVLYELLAGRLPFVGGNEFALARAHLESQPPSLRQWVPSIPKPLEDAVMKALAKNPAQRFAGAEAMALALNNCLPGVAGPGARSGASIWRRLFLPGKPTAASQDTAAVMPPLPPSNRVSGQPQSNATRFETVLVARGNIDRTGTDPGSPPAGGLTRIFHIEGGTQGPASDSERVVEERPPVHLVFKSCSDPLLSGKSVEVRTVPFRIGRSAADLFIPADNGISRNHAEIDWMNGMYVVRDLGSRNGTFIQGRRVSGHAPEPLHFGATIRLSGSTELTLVSDEDTAMPDLTGTVLDGRYALVRLIRTTGKATLYEATDTRLPHKVAVKVLSPILARYPGYLEDFRHEAKMAAELQHPHIVRVLDSGAAQLPAPSSSICNYVCLELLSKGDLADRLRKRSFLPLEEALGILDGVSDALEYAHGIGIVHRGLKPSSILFGHNGFAFLSDFAFAARSGDLRRMFVGAPDFLAPEQWEGSAITAAADQYSLTALAYLMLTGSPPLRGQQDPDIRASNRLRGPDAAHEEAARKGNSNIPVAVSEVLSRALSPDPASRYPSIREFFLNLKRAAGQRAIVRDGPPRVFISYQRDTSAGWAVLFSRELEQRHGIISFVDTQRMDSAVQLPVKLSRAIKDSDIFVCFLSDKTLNSQWVREEIRLAWENNKPMVPIFQENFEQPQASEKLDEHIGALISFEGVHLLDRRNIYVDDAISRLARIVEQSVKRIRGNYSSESNARS